RFGPFLTCQLSVTISGRPTAGSGRGARVVSHRSSHHNRPMKLDSKYFDRIRIKPDPAAAPAEAGPVCEWDSCDQHGSYRAPKGRSAEGRYFHFCLDHVRLYNQSYNYFAGMPD